MHKSLVSRTAADTFECDSKAEILRDCCATIEKVSNTLWKNRFLGKKLAALVG